MQDANVEYRELKKSQRTKTFDVLSLLQTGADASIEYQDSQDLKQIRFAYITHLIDWLVTERKQVNVNTVKCKKEEDKNKVTIDNVFEIEKAKNEGNDEESEEDVK